MQYYGKFFRYTDSGTSRTIWVIRIRFVFYTKEVSTGGKFYFNSAGKTVTFARTVDIPRSEYNFRFFASSVLHHTTDCSQMDHMGCLNYTVRCPVGVGESLACFPQNLQSFLLASSVLLDCNCCVLSRLDQSLEPPSVPPDVENCPGNRHGQHSRGQTKRDDLCDCVDDVQAIGGSW